MWNPKLNLLVYEKSIFIPLLTIKSEHVVHKKKDVVAQKGKSENH